MLSAHLRRHVIRASRAAPSRWASTSAPAPSTFWRNFRLFAGATTLASTSYYLGALYPPEFALLLSPRTAPAPLHPEDPAALTRLQEANERLRSATDPEAEISADTAFHDVVVALSGNPLLPGQLDTLVPILLRAEYLHFDAQTAAASATQHDAICDALIDGDADRAADLTRENWLSLG